MASIRTFLQRHAIGAPATNRPNASLTSTAASADSASDTSSSIATRSNTQSSDGYSSTSTLGHFTVNNDASIRRPLLHLPTTKRRKNLLLRLVHNPPPMPTPQEQPIHENVCLLDGTLPKELILRYR